MNEKVWKIEWFGVEAYIQATSRDKAKAQAMRSAQDAGYWWPGESMKGLRATVAPYVPPDATVMYARTP